MLRNVFDQYEQPENRLTHALVTAFHHDRKLLAAFLKMIEIDPPCAVGSLKLVEQSLPGDDPEREMDQLERGLPDMVIFNNEGWAILVEAKAQAMLALDQLRRHRNTLIRRGFDRPWIVAITPEKVGIRVGALGRLIQWKEVYALASQHVRESFWARTFCDYIEVFEARSMRDDYNLRDTLTRFNGLRFSEENPYTYPQGKRLIKLLGAELRKRKRLSRIGADLDAPGRSAITRGGGRGVWDFLHLKGASAGVQFTQHPHLTFGVHSGHLEAALTLPNGMRGDFRSRLAGIGLEEFVDVLAEVESNMRPLIRLVQGAQPMALLVQRHFLTQNSHATEDANLRTDLRTVIPRGKGRVKYQPEWIAAIFEILTHKRSNLQLQLAIGFPTTSPHVQSAYAADLVADTWIACRPFIRFALEK